MESSTGLQGQNNINLTIRISIETSSQDIDLPCDEMDLDDEYNVISTQSEDIKDEYVQWAEIESLSRTPSPEFDAESYATWGREHFGEEWYRQRNEMLNERNIFMSPDPIYKQRQSALRMLERQIEGRTSMLPYGTDGEEGLPPKEDMESLSQIPLDNEARPSGSQTQARLSPLPSDPWRRLEHYRKCLQWDDLEYHIEIALLEESLIDLTRSQREDAEGDKQREFELEEMHNLHRESWQYQQQKRRFQLLALGWSQRRVEAQEREEIAMAERLRKARESGREDLVPLEMGDVIEGQDGEEDSGEDSIY